MNGKENIFEQPNTSKASSRPKMIGKYGDNLKSIFARIPKEVLREMPVIETSKSFKRKQYINGISKKKKPDINRINKEMDNSEIKLLSDINGFKERFYEYNKDQEDQMENFEKIQEENDKFSKVYKKLQKEKGKFNTGTYLDYKPFINIASRYLSRNMNVPNLSNEHSIFSGNPLILAGSDLQDYFSYNLGNKKKAMVFLKKVDNIVNRKKTGNTKLTNEEIEHLEKVLQQEKPKGYIAPEVLISKLKNDIIKSADTCNNLVKFEQFFMSFDKKRKLNDYMSSYKNISKSTGNIFNKVNKNYPTTLSNTNNYSKIYLNRRKINNYTNILNNNSVTGTTGIFATRKSSIKDNSKEFTGNTNISSILSGRNSTSLKYSPIVSPFGRKVYNDQTNETVIANRINSSKIDFQKNLNLMPKTFDISSITNVERVGKKNILANIQKSNLLKSNKKKTLRFKDSAKSSANLNNENSVLNDKKGNMTYGSDRGEIVELINGIERKNLIRLSKENSINEINDIDNQNEETDTLDNKNQIINNNTSQENNISNNQNNLSNNQNKNKNYEQKNNYKNLGIHKSKIIKPRTPTQKELEKMKYQKLENLFDKALNLRHNQKNKGELEDYVISIGRIPNKKINTKDTYFNIYRTKEKAVDNNLILEEYMIRNGSNDKKSLTKEQNNILDKNSYFKNEMVNYEMKFKEMLCEETMEK